ncbi:OmpA family protein [Spirosoma foliorum]|uniref:OmpA family protein n=1 Tax=Spirosoma foliorum TaxID=2710596 RepID=A0A7G5GVX4_9BACT|nr:OmpA family protein [Spirosoma foliorum]QMW03016.1 OmpA family protein [Spirosoma foliorum]
MSKLWVWWMGLGVWVIVSVCVHLFYIKRIRLSEEPVLPPVHIIDGNQLRIQLRGNLFQQAGSELKSIGNRSANSRSGNIRSGLDTLADYLKANPRRWLTVIGYYTPAEGKQTLISNLGVLRATSVQQYLVSAGVPEEQIKVWGEASNALLFVQDSTNALSFAFQSITIDANWLARHQKYVDLFHPLQLYFQTGSTAYIHTPDNEQFAREAIAYLRNHKRDRLVITGHTDSVGTEVRNLQLSRLRARVIQDSLVKQGADKRWLQLVAQGDKSPIAPNALPEGREANRRVTLLVERR